MSAAGSKDVLFAEQGNLGRITLNRPKAINALTHGMINAIDAALRDWAGNPAIKLVLIEGAGERGFCAGGDIRALYDAVKAGSFADPEAFFRDEYRLNAQIAEYPKPVVTFMDGIVMGGGIGLSAHASHRVVTPRSILAMPEVGIGFVPDVGGTFLLARAPGHLGMHAALTGCRLSAADALVCGLADICVAVESLPDLAVLLTGCIDAQAIQSALQAHAQTLPQGMFEKNRQWIDSVYASTTLETILAAMELRDEPEAKSALREIAGKSPTSVKVALRLLLEARVSDDLRTCLQREYDAALTIIRNHDFVEGVRAAVVDKDRTPDWSPATLADVTSQSVDVYFRISPDTAIF
jgi:enoyl-CoA hydratase